MNYFVRNNDREQMQQVLDEIGEFVYPTRAHALKLDLRGASLHKCQESFKSAVFDYYKFLAAQEHGNSRGDALSKVLQDNGVPHVLKEEHGIKHIELN